MRPVIALVALSLACARGAVEADEVRRVGGACEACDGIYQGMPARLASESTIVAAGEPGEPLEVSGTIYRPDGRTPAADVILYVYQTAASGRYEPADGLTGSARRHGRLRGWVRTGSDGRYLFRTIRPGAYPGGGAPAHIHPIIKEPGTSEYWVDEILFDDDPLVTSQVRAAQPGRGGPGIIKVAKDQRGVWVGRRDFVLGRNVPGY